MDKNTLITQLQQNAAETPYAIAPTEKGFELSLNIVDAKWYTLFYKNGLKKIFKINTVLNESKHQAATTDELFELKWQGGVGATDMMPRIGGKMNVQKGEVISYQSHKEYGVSESGQAGQVVNYTFNSHEAKNWLNEQLKAAGWSRGVSLEVKIGLWVGIGSLILALGTGVALVLLLNSQ